MEDLGSEFGTDSEAEVRKVAKARRKDLLNDPKPHTSKVGKDFFGEEQSRDARRRTNHFVLDAYSRHKELINNYLLTVPGATKTVLARDTSRDRNDKDVIRENHRFLWDESSSSAQLNWEQRLAKRYYDKLFKEYCIASLERYQENKIALRWRVEKEVLEGKGQFICGARRCPVRADLSSWEVNFAYVEDGAKKSALVKLRLCPDCSIKLNYHHRRRKAQPKTRRPSKRHRTHRSRGEKKTEEEEEAELEWAEKKPSKKRRTDDSDGVKEEPESEEASAAKSAAESGGAEVWSGPAPVEEEKSREDEIDEFLQDLFL